MIRKTAQSVWGTRGAVSSGHPLASLEAIAVLRAGGNAVDAAVAGAVVLAVVSPHACGLGGDAFLIIHDSRSGRTEVVNGSGAAPAAATPRIFVAGLPHDGPRSLTVPGALAAWNVALKRFGTRTLADLLVPAIGYAAEGFCAYDYLIENIYNRRILLAQNPAASRAFLPGGAPPRRGEIIRQPELAEVLSRVAKYGPEEFYAGDTAAKIVRDLEALGGLLSTADLAAHVSLCQEPLSASVFGCEIATAPPNSWGLAFLLQVLRMQGSDSSGPAAERIRREMNAWRDAMTAAAPAVADPVAVERTARTLLARVCDRSNLHTEPLVVDVPRGSDTTAINVIDNHGNAVSLIQSVFTPFGSGIVAAGTGVVLNNRLSGFNVVDGHPNCVAPAKRPAHTLIPVLVLNGGAVKMAISTPGAAGQVCTLAQILVRTLSYGEDLADAISAPRWSVGADGGFLFEDEVDEPLRSELLTGDAPIRPAAMGSFTFGSVKAVARDGSSLRAVADARRVAAAQAW